MKVIEYDFFISHASEDKESFVRPLASALMNIGYRIWYDEFSMKVGDSLVESISNGLKNSQYGVLILSKNFFKKQWPQKELNALINKEIVTDDNLILPIWLNIEAEEIYEHAPLLIDKLAIKVSDNDIKTALSGIEKIGLRITSKNQVEDLINSLFNCNMDRRNKYFRDLENRIRQLFLFQEEFYNWYISDDLFAEDEWNDLLITKKRAELIGEYNIPRGVWTNEEPFRKIDIERAVALCKKWVYRRMTYEDYEELFLLLEEILDSDLTYVLYNLPHSTIQSPVVYEECLRGLLEIGIKNPERRNLSKKEKDRISTKVFDKYYGG